ncbi:unnamed protein product, partial [Amoebophrya sp. A25]
TISDAGSSRLLVVLPVSDSSEVLRIAKTWMAHPDVPDPQACRLLLCLLEARTRGSAGSRSASPHDEKKDEEQKVWHDSLRDVFVSRRLLKTTRP